jgi:cell division septal protein FtsQ
MLKYHEKERKKAVTSLISERKTTIRSFLQKRKRHLASLFVLILLCGIFFTLVLPNINLEFMAFSDVKPQKLDRISEYTFRKIIGYGYEEEIYVKDTAEIRSRLEADSMIFGDVKFIMKLIPYELEIAFKESSPLFALMSQRSDTVPVIYSDKGKIYPYSTNAADLPVVDANNLSDISLATNFLMDMKKNDALLYSRVSQLIPRADEKQIAVFFNDVDFKTVFSLEYDYWKTAFRYYRQLTRNMRNLDINSIAVLDLRFKNLAFTKEKDGGL